MRLTITLIALIAFGSLFAQNNSLEVRTQKNELFYLYLNNFQFNTVAQTSVTTGVLTPGYYKLKIVFSNEGYGQSEALVNVLENQNVQLELIQGVYYNPGMGKTELRYQINETTAFGSVKPLEEEVAESEIGDIKYHENQVEVPEKQTVVQTEQPVQQAGKITPQVLQTIEKKTDTEEAKNNAAKIKVDLVEQNNKVVVVASESSRIDETVKEIDAVTTVEDAGQSGVTTIIDGKGNTFETAQKEVKTVAPDQKKTVNAASMNKQVVTPSGSCSETMPTEDFNLALEAVASKSQDETKLALAKQVLSSNCASVVQIRQMLDLLSKEKSKLNLAISAHEKCIDKHNYWKINDAFKFENSIIDLNSAIAN